MTELKYFLIFATALAGAIGTFLDVYKKRNDRRVMTYAGKFLIGLIILSIVITMYLQKIENQKQQIVQETQDKQYSENVGKMNTIIDGLSTTLESSLSILKTIGKVNEVTIHVMYRQNLGEVENSVLKDIFDDIAIIGKDQKCVTGFPEYESKSHLGFLKSFQVQCDQQSNGFFAHYMSEGDNDTVFNIPDYWKEIKYHTILIADRSGIYKAKNVVLSKEQYLKNVYIDFDGNYYAIIENMFGFNKPKAVLAYYPKEGIVSLHTSNKIDLSSKNEYEWNADTPLNSTDFTTTDLYLAQYDDSTKIEPYYVLLESDKYKRVAYHVEKMDSIIRDNEGNRANLQLYRLKHETDPIEAFEAQAANYRGNGSV